MEEYKELISLLIPITICIIFITFIQFIKFIDYIIKANEDYKEKIETNKNKKLKKEIKEEIIEYYNNTNK